MPKCCDFFSLGQDNTGCFLNPKQYHFFQFVDDFMAATRKKIHHKLSSRWNFTRAQCVRFDITKNRHEKSSLSVLLCFFRSFSPFLLRQMYKKIVYSMPMKRNADVWSSTLLPHFHWECISVKWQANVQTRRKSQAKFIKRSFRFI